MIVKNTRYYYDMPFEDYISLPGVSFSSLKGAIPESAGMRLGTRVHNYLNEPQKYDWQQVEDVKKIAAFVRARFGDIILHTDKEVVVTADFIHNDMILHFKGRIDWFIPAKLICDLKILSTSIQAACDLFGYENQLSGYSLAAGIDNAMIIAYNKRNSRVELKKINIRTDFWQYQVARLGEPVNVLHEL